VFYNEVSKVSDSVQKIFLDDRLLYDWQKMWVLSLFYTADNVPMAIVHQALNVLEDSRVNAVLRALCSLIISKHGDGSSRRIIRNHYADEPSNYVKEAILYSTKFFPSNEEKNTCIRTWETHSEISKLISIAMKNESRNI
jgi:hypothetical protein